MGVDVLDAGPAPQDGQQIADAPRRDGPRLPRKTAPAGSWARPEAPEGRIAARASRTVALRGTVRSFRPLPTTRALPALGANCTASHVKPVSSSTRRPVCSSVATTAVVIGPTRYASATSRQRSSAEKPLGLRGCCAAGRTRAVGSDRIQSAPCAQR